MEGKRGMIQMRFAYPVRIRRTCLLACLVIITVLLLLGGCTQSDVEEGKRPSTTQEEVDSFFSLSVRSNVSPIVRSMQMTAKGVSVSDSVQTRAAAALDEEKEKYIKTLWLGQYDPSGGLVKEQYFASLTSQDGVDVRLVKSEGEQTVYLIANAGNLQGKADKVGDLLKLQLDYSSTSDGKPSDNTCMMTGSWRGTVGGSGLSGEVELTRLVAKISFSYSVGGTDFSFTPSKVSLHSVPTKSSPGEPEGQLSGISYTDYTETAPAGTSATVCWYLPENKAGVATGENAVVSEKLKTGKGVENATYIELQGTAVQNNVTYKNVNFRLYPGSGTDNSMNDYMIRRNNYYALEIRLTGIDFSDERVTLEKEPEFENPDNLGSEKGASKSFQVTTQPGKPWSFILPLWLSAKIGNMSISAGSEIGFQGPALVEFIAATANPKGEERRESIVIDNKEVVVTQNPSSLNTGGAVSLEAVSGSLGQSSFMATKGLPWVASLSSDWGDWLGWQGGAVSSGNEAAGSNQPLMVQAVSSNPSAAQRSGRITVKGGDALAGNYSGLTREVTVTQAASTLTGSTVSVAAEAADSQTGSFNATKGLSWSATTATGWLTLADVAGSTSGSSQSLTFNVTKPNPSSSVRSGKITVRAGNASTDAHPGPSNDINVNQAASTLSVSAAKTVTATASTGNISTFKATKGLSWNVGVTSTGNWLTLSGSGATSGTDNTSGTDQNVTYDAVVNPNASTREGTITVKAGNAVGGTDAALTKTVAVTQSASALTASVNPTTALAATKDATGTYTINGTRGLSYSFTAGFPDWLTVTNGTALTGGGTTTGANQQLTYKTASVNPNNAERSGTVTVKAGNISKDVIIKQSASTFSVANGAATIAATGGSTTGSVAATAGLAWTISPATHNGLTVAPTAGSGDQQLTFTGSANTSLDRTGSFTVSVTGASPARTSTVTANQWSPGAYASGIQVCKTDEASTNWSTANSNCNNSTKEGKSDWRLPTKSELYAMYIDMVLLKATPGFRPCEKSTYWSSEAYGDGNHEYCYIESGSYYYQPDFVYHGVRCVRTK